MALTEVLAHIDAEIARLQQARALLADQSGAPATDRPKRGRPAKAASADGQPAKPAGKRQLSPEGRKAIADAMKKRWAERRSKQNAA